MFDFLTHLFDPSGFPPRWNCGSWTAVHGWLHILSDLGVWSAYLAIPCVLAWFVLKKKDVPFRTIFLLFGAFILACGTTHLMEAIIFWWPAYRLAGLIKLFTAVISWATVVALIPVTPKALAMRTPEELQQEIEERKRVEIRLQKSVEEKEVLLKEIHHRVKNNLQVISSLLDLQADRATDTPSVEMFRESQTRVRSMALIHERLYRSQDLARVDFAEYIESLAHSLFLTYRVDTDAIQLELHLSLEVKLSIETAMPCGLLVNELLSNCLKHAFRGREKGIIRIDLLPVQGASVQLRVADNGVGLPAHLSPESADTFGFQLVTMLVRQLKGTMTIDRVVGTTVVVDFPLAKVNVL